MHLRQSDKLLCYQCKSFQPEGYRCSQHGFKFNDADAFYNKCSSYKNSLVTEDLCPDLESQQKTTLEPAPQAL